MHQLQARLASKWSVFTLSACNTHAGTAHRRHVPDCGRTAITGDARNFVIVISTTLPTGMDAIWHKVLRTNIPANINMHDKQCDELQQQLQKPKHQQQHPSECDGQVCD
jgi:hypothetical protein